MAPQDARARIFYKVGRAVVEAFEVTTRGRITGVVLPLEKQRLNMDQHDMSSRFCSRIMQDL